MKKKVDGLKLRRIREEAGLTRDQFASRIGVSTTTLKQVELGYQYLGKAAWVHVRQIAAGSRGEVHDGGTEYGTSSKSPDLDKIIKAMLDPEQQENARIISERLKIPIERAWGIVLRENGKG